VNLTDPGQLLSHDIPFRSLADRAPVMLWVTDAHGTPLLLNAAWRAFRALPADGQPESWLHGIEDEDLSNARDAFLAAHATRTAFTAEYRVRQSDGAIRWVHDRGTPWFGEAGRFIGFMGCCVDITDQRRQRESEAQMRELAARLQRAREDERTEVARELHDELGQTLTSMKLEISRAVAAFASDPTSVTTVDRLQSIVGLVDIGIGMVKRMSARLRPATLDHLGLAEAIRWEVLTFKARTGIRCQVRSNRQQTRLTAEQQTALFRIVQEALNNVVCHANASSVHITLKEDDRGLELRVRDNGRGITAAQVAAPESIGLLGMRERAARIGGVFKVSGQRGKGTVVTVYVPINTQAAVNPVRTEAESHIG
jgi:two-component system sensor histidine kinase UhpB